MIADTFLDIADALETGSFGRKPVIGIAVAGTELGMENIYEGACLAEKRGYKTVVIDGEDAHKEMEKMLEAGEIDGAVTMHYPFPIGVSTVGRVVTPGRGREMFLATTTENGYPIKFGSSSRADGGVVMRGNDLLEASADVMVTDPLTGNLLMKIFSAYTTGGSYESLGYGYGPGIGEGFDKVIMIISRASGAPVIAGAVEYASQLIEANVLNIAEKEFEAANSAGLSEILESLKGDKKSSAPAEEVKMPEKEVVTYEIHGIEVIDLDDAAASLWAKGIYAETGMGCTGPVILVSEANGDTARKILEEADYIS